VSLDEELGKMVKVVIMTTAGKGSVFVLKCLTENFEFCVFPVVVVFRT
jgi:hypothetical protein